MKEFDLINKYFRPLTSYEVSYNLKDDTAVFEEKLPIIQTSDTLIEGVHFFKNDLPENIIKRAMAVNLSDIASMGGIPKYYLLSLSISKSQKYDDHWFQKLSSELSLIQKVNNIILIGGNTAFYKGPLNITINMIGVLPSNNVKPLLQGTALPGDSIYISNTVGDAYFGLKYLQQQNGCYKYLNIFSKLRMKQYHLSYDDINYLCQAFYNPEPQIILGQLLLKYANSCTDISDGLWKDLEKICRHSNVTGKLNLEAISFSKAVTKIINHTNNKDKLKTLVEAISNGDDYQLVFTVPTNKEIGLIEDCKKNKIKIQKIGTILNQAIDNSHVNVYYDNICINESFPKRGYEHQSTKKKH